MSSIGTGYDLSASSFSPDGRIFQIEYAQKVVDASGTAVGLVGKNGVVLAVEKVVQSKLYEDHSNKRIFDIDKHIGAASAGFLTDARALVKIGHDETANFRKSFGYEIPVKYCVHRLSMYSHLYTLYSGLRPFGCSVLMAGMDKNQPGKGELYMVDPSAVGYSYHGCAIGKAKQNAKTEIEKIMPKLKDMDMTTLVKEAAKIIYHVHDEVKDKMFLLEMSYIGTETNGKHKVICPDDKLYKDAVQFAKESLDDSDDE